MRWTRAAVCISVISATSLLVAAQGQSPQPQPRRASVAAAVRDRIQQEGRARVIVELDVAIAPEGMLPDIPAILSQRQAIASARTRVLGRLAASFPRVIHRFQTVPFVAIDVDANGLAALESSGSEVVRVVEDAIVRPSLADSVPLVQGDQAWDVGYDGAGT